MLKAILIEDEAAARAALQQEIRFHCPEVKVLGEASNVKSGIALIRELQPELVFLDIQLTDGVGFDILEAVDDLEFNVIFTTAFSEYALKAIKFSALDYLLKPIDSKELQAAVRKAMEPGSVSVKQKLENYLRNLNAHDPNKRIALHSSSGVDLVELRTIIRVGAEGNYSKFYFDNGKSTLIAKTLKEFEELLTPFAFERIHHSHIVNLDHLQSYRSKDNGFVEMSDGSTLPVAQRKKARLLAILADFNRPV